MKLVAFLAALVAVLVFAPSALAYERAPALVEQTASRIAGRSVEVLCYARGEDNDPYEWFDAWGYVYPDVAVEHMAAEVCDGANALATDDPAVPDWKKALGALVLAHESYHLAHRYGRSRLDEAATECRAVRHVRYVMQFLGATPERASQLMGWALFVHWRIGALAPRYFDPKCAVPNPW